MLVVGASVEHDVAFYGGITRVRVIRHLVGVEDVSAVMDLSLATQFEYGAVLFLLDGADRDLFLAYGGGNGRRRFRRDGC